MKKQQFIFLSLTALSLWYAPCAKAAIQYTQATLSDNILVTTQPYYMKYIVENPDVSSKIRGFLEGKIDESLITDALSGDYEVFKLVVEMSADNRPFLGYLKILSDNIKAEERFSKSTTDAMFASDPDEEASLKLAKTLAEEDKKEDQEMRLKQIEADERAARKLRYEQFIRPANPMGGGGPAHPTRDKKGVKLHPNVIKMFDRVPYIKNIFINGVTHKDGTPIGTPQDWRTYLINRSLFSKDVVDYLNSTEFKDAVQGKDKDAVFKFLDEKYNL